RIIFTVLTEFGLVHKFRMLPMIVPALHRALTPKIDWIGLRHVFIAFSTLWAGLGVVMIAYEGKDLLDTEFRGGTAVTIQLKPDPAGDGRALVMKREEVKGRIDQVAAKHSTDGLDELKNASVLVVNPQADGVSSSQFTIKTVLTDTKAVEGAIVEALGDKID